MSDEKAERGRAGECISPTPGSKITAVSWTLPGGREADFPRGRSLRIIRRIFKGAASPCICCDSAKRAAPYRRGNNQHEQVSPFTDQRRTMSQTPGPACKVRFWICPGGSLQGCYIHKIHRLIHRVTVGMIEPVHQPSPLYVVPASAIYAT